jgi:hypothetical protein
LTEALPILSEYSFFATAFLISGRMKVAEGVLNPYGDALTWGEARVLRDSGHFSLQSHSHSHSRWPLDTNGQQQVAAELALSHQALVNELGSTQGHFHHLAWPWGRCNAAFEKTALDLGFTYQYLVQKGAVTHAGTKLRLPRLCCDGMPTVTFSRWIDLLTKPYPALAVNCVYGSIRQWRHGLAYH